MGGGGAHVDPFDIFSSFFGPSFGGIPWCYPYSCVTFFLLCSFYQCDNYFLNVFFTGGGGSSRGRRQRRGEDVVHPLKVSLEDLYNGTSKKLSLSRNVLCSKCKGLVLFGPPNYSNHFS